MVMLRLVQGFCLGGELPGALTYVVETAPRHRAVCLRRRVLVRHAWASRRRPASASRCAPGCDRSWCRRYGWRIAFILGGLGGVLSFVLRRSLEESPEFARMKSLASRQPFREVLRTHLRHGRSSASRVLAGTGVLQRPVLLAPAGVPVGRAALRPAPGRVLADRRRHRVSARHSRVGLAWRSHCRRAICCAPASPAAGRLALPFYRALAGARVNLTVLLVAGRASRRTHQRLVRRAADRSVSDAHPLQRRRAGLQRRFTIFSGTAPLVATTLIG